MGTGSTHLVPGRLIQASVRMMLTPLAPALWISYHAGEALGIDAWVYFSLLHAQHVGCLLPKVLVIHDP